MPVTILRQADDENMDDEHVDVHVPIMLPHEVLGALCRAGPETRDHSLGDTARVREFWQLMQPVSYLHDHPVAQHPECHDTIPLGCFSDGVQFSKQESALTMLWSSILAPAHRIQENRFMITTVPVGNLLPGSLRQLLTTIAWSFAACFDGRYPRRDERFQEFPAGTKRAELAGKEIGLRAIVFDHRGDWAQQASWWGLPLWNQSPMCLRCTATQTGMSSWAHFGPGAQWRLQELSTAAYLGGVLPRVLNPLARLPGFHAASIKFDEMHTIKMGIGRSVVACTLLDLLERGRWGNGVGLDIGLAQAWASFRRFLRRHGLYSNQRRFTRARLGVAAFEYPEAATKAWNCRLLTSWLAAEVVAWQSPADPARRDHIAMVTACAWSLNEMFLLQEEARHVFTHDQAARYLARGALLHAEKKSLL